MRSVAFLIEGQAQGPAAGDPPPESLRARKKRLTRAAIFDAAQRLFAERGFDDVTVAEIADAANISVKTLFSYVRSKEELVFGDGPTVLDAVVAAVRDRRIGQTPLVGRQPGPGLAGHPPVGERARNDPALALRWHRDTNWGAGNHAGSYGGQNALALGGLCGLPFPAGERFDDAARNDAARPDAARVAAAAA